MYAMICTHPDISYALSMTSIYQSNSGEGHWIAVKNILKYLKRTKDSFLVYGGDEKLVVKGYTGASFQTDRDDSVSQSDPLTKAVSQQKHEGHTSSMGIKYIGAATGNEQSIPKPRAEWSDPHIEQVHKDKKTMNILFNGVDGDMFDNIINYKTAKDVWDII
ncbi:hypothetical protein AgCh_025236 [Apium graveolens]